METDMKRHPKKNNHEHVQNEHASEIRDKNITFNVLSTAQAVVSSHIAQIRTKEKSGLKGEMMIRIYGNETAYQII